ncbi:MAG: hypothetical protein IPL59_08445 [Candidatus Competibacteraceae bacterium]|nr:hypothetical protein [Candidatus Competibacteraceae bacterium]
MNALGRIKPVKRPSAAAVRREGLSVLLRLLSPIVPHITASYGENSVMALTMLNALAELTKQRWRGRFVALVVQVNGKLRGSQIEVPVDAERGVIEQAAQTEPNVQRFIEQAKSAKSW